MDARQRRSREKLQRALFDLAATRPVNELTVSELATAAGVNRSTFYEHSTSPQALLVELLGAELDALREQYLTGIQPADAAQATADVTRAVLSHIEVHAEIYRFGLSEANGASSLHAMLSSHFEASIRLLVEQHSLTIEDEDARARPSGAPRAAVNDATTTSDADLAVYAARYISSGTVGIITAWLDEPQRRSIDAVMHAYRQLLPGWWPLAQ